MRPVQKLLLRNSLEIAAFTLGWIFQWVLIVAVLLLTIGSVAYVIKLAFDWLSLCGR